MNAKRLNYNLYTSQRYEFFDSQNLALSFIEALDSDEKKVNFFRVSIFLEDKNAGDNLSNI